mmetsp:Transcript_35458/g.62862  ORF Transcript_35458/g.62862 Transcript_35458/m.62862 type:complete len:89 (-) Transcript_35458:50-316(-)
MGFKLGVLTSTGVVGVPVPPVVPSICVGVSSGGLSRGFLKGGSISSAGGIRGDAAGERGDFMDTRRNAEGDTSGPLVGVCGRLRGVEP